MSLLRRTFGLITSVTVINSHITILRNRNEFLFDLFTLTGAIADIDDVIIAFDSAVLIVFHARSDGHVHVVLRALRRVVVMRIQS